MNDNSLSQPAWLWFLVGWIGVNLLGGAVGGILEERFQFLGTLVLFGTPLGVAQWLLLRRYIPRAWLWALVLVLGWPVANLITIAVDPLLYPIIQTLRATGLLWEVFWLNLVRWPVVLLIIGLLQGFLLTPRRRTVPLWLLANLVGGLVVGATGATVCYQVCSVITQSAGVLTTGAVLGAATWAAYAIVTGRVLARLLRQR
ncbi:MAG: hypothetical protein R3E79_34590 [Caldilineaceae bacterium]